MNIGEKIINLRKEKNITQEELAEVINVTRQTISKWELNETSPDIKQALLIANYFNISLDELVGNNTNTLLNKVSNTERLAGITIKILKIIGIIFLTLLIIDVIAFIIFITHKVTTNENEIVGKYSITCNLNNEEYSYELNYNKNYAVITSGGDEFIANHTDVSEYLEDVNIAEAHIEDYFKNLGGSCKTIKK